MDRMGDTWERDDGWDKNMVQNFPFNMSLLFDIDSTQCDFPSLDH